MCLYPRIIKNRKYQITKKNKGIIPKIKDERTQYVTIGCNKCIECMKKKTRDWKVRLNEEIRTDNSGKFVTLTFNEESLNKFKNELKNTPPELLENEIATRAVRLFLERYRKKYKKSVKHFLITEKGHTNTERIHLHGLIFTNNNIEKIWQYGYIFTGQFVNEKTINYITKYITKIDFLHKDFVPKILCSPGIGKNYINRLDSKRNHYNENTNETYITRTGTKLPLPIYYRNKLYTDEQKEKLWIKKLDEETRYVCGEKIDVSTDKGEKEYERIREFYRTKNTQLGYGKISWNSKIYKKNLKKLKKPKKIINIEDNLKPNKNEYNWTNTNFENE